MQGQLLHTPEGVRDIYGAEGERKRKLEERLMHRLHLAGYQDIRTPGFEFFDVFRKERGTVPVNDMYRFFDREGNTLVLRPDFTPAIARCAAKYYREETGALRFCYQGDTYVNNVSFQGKLKETTQIGVELIQEPSVYGDAELLALTVQSLLDAGLTEFQLEVGNAGFFCAILEQTTLSEEDVLELRRLIEDKYSYGVEQFLADHAAQIPAGCVALLKELPESFGGAEEVRRLREFAGAAGVREAEKSLDRLLELERILAVYGCADYVTYDLGMLGKLGYYTGIIFRGYTYGTGEAVVSGGRYDHLVGQFGKEAPAVGMAINVDLLLLALGRQEIRVPSEPEPVVIRCDREHAEEGIRRKAELHGKGIPAILQVADEGV